MSRRLAVGLHLGALAALAVVLLWLEASIRGLTPWYIMLPPLLLPCALLLRGRDRWAVLASVLIGAELLCAHSVWHTVGEVWSAFSYALVWINVLPTLLLVAGKRRIGLVGLALATVPLVPLPVVYLIEWACIHHEAERIIAYVDEHRTPGGTAPALDGYDFRFNWTAEHIRYAPAPYRSPYLHNPFAPPEPPDNSFSLCYWISHKGTSHCAVDSGTGWFYYPD